MFVALVPHDNCMEYNMSAFAWNKLFRHGFPVGKARVRSAIGLEIAQQSLNMVQLEQDIASNIRVCDWKSKPLSMPRHELVYDAATLKSYIQDILPGSSFKGRDVNAMLPASELKIMSVNYVLERNNSTDNAIATILAERLEHNLDHYVIDYLPVRQCDEAKKGLAVVAVAEREKVLAYLECLHNAGLNVKVMDIGPAAIKRLVTAMHKPSDGETVMVINFGMKYSYLSIISGRRLLFDEEISFGEDLLVKQIADKLDLPHELAREQVRQCGIGRGESTELDQQQHEVADTLLQILKPQFRQLVDSLKRALVYAVAETRGEPISQIYLVGSIARWRGTAAELNRLMDLPVNILPDPLIKYGAKLGGDKEELSTHPELALATGLALRDLDCHA